jgi:ADP-dependent phosphofructokinase/glucokinase
VCSHSVSRIWINKGFGEMSNRFAMGFQNTVDFELVWDPQIIESLIVSFDIHDNEIHQDIKIESQRDMVIALLSHMKEGTGTERDVISSAITRGFAAHFHYNVTLGGTAVRAAVAMSNIGYTSTIHACSLNRHFCALIPKNVDWLASVPDEGEDFHPHVITQFPSKAHISANDINITTPRPNRVIFAHDPPSEQLVIDENFKNKVKDAGVFLAASYNVMKDESLLRDRLQTTINIMHFIPSGCVTIMEDGCFENINIRRIVTETLGPHLDIFSMNEDELQDRIGRKFDFLDPKIVADSILQVSRQINSPILVCHSAYWVLAYGQNPASIKNALDGGITMASTRFRLGDRYCTEDYIETKRIAPLKAGVDFSRQITDLLGVDRIVCLPGKDLDFVSHPSTIGLGDAFVGGMLPNLLPAEG